MADAARTVRASGSADFAPVLAPSSAPLLWGASTSRDATGAGHCPSRRAGRYAGGSRDRVNRRDRCAKPVVRGDRGAIHRRAAATPGRCCSRGSMMSFRFSAHAVVARCESSPSSSRPVPGATPLTHLGEPTSPPRLMPARAPPLWERKGATMGEDDPRLNPLSDLRGASRWRRPCGTGAKLGPIPAP